MSWMTVDFVDEITGEQFEGLIERETAPEFGTLMEYEGRKVRRIPSIMRKAIIPSHATRAVSKQRWHPAFKHHDERGFGIVQSKTDVQAALDWSKRNATSEDEEWTWDEKAKA